MEKIPQHNLRPRISGSCSTFVLFLREGRGGLGKPVPICSHPPERLRICRTEGGYPNLVMASSKSALGFPIIGYVLMHRSLVERHLPAESCNWPWSSWRRYRREVHRCLSWTWCHDARRHQNTVSAPPRRDHQIRAADPWAAESALHQTGLAIYDRYIRFLPSSIWMYPLYTREV